MSPTELLMNDSIQQPTSLPEVLLGYLQLQGALPWPGADGLTVAEVLAAYPGEARLGRVPGLEQLSRRHPELAGAATAFFAASAPPLPGCRRANDAGGNRRGRVCRS